MIFEKNQYTPKRLLPHSPLPTPYSLSTQIISQIKAELGNPKGINTWADLAKDGVKVIAANPKTSGIAIWEFLAFWGSVTLTGGDETTASGTGGGFSKFCHGDIDIAGASRTIRNEEIKKCQSKNIEFVELPIALDGIAVIANRKNNFAKCLTIKELGKIWGAKSDGKILNWNQVNPKFPNEKLKL